MDLNHFEVMSTREVTPLPSETEKLLPETQADVSDSVKPNNTKMLEFGTEKGFIVPQGDKWFMP